MGCALPAVPPNPQPCPTPLRLTYQVLPVGAARQRAWRQGEGAESGRKEPEKTVSPGAGSGHHPIPGSSPIHFQGHCFGEPRRDELGSRERSDSKDPGRGQGQEGRRALPAWAATPMGWVVTTTSLHPVLRGLEKPVQEVAQSRP